MLGAKAVHSRFFEASVSTVAESPGFPRGLTFWCPKQCSCVSTAPYQVTQTCVEKHAPFCSCLSVSFSVGTTQTQHFCFETDLLSSLVVH